MLANAGATVTASDRETLTVSGLPAERVVALLGERGLPVTEIAQHRASLEEAYMELTRDALDYEAVAVGEAIAVTRLRAWPSGPSCGRFRRWVMTLAAVVGLTVLVARDRGQQPRRRHRRRGAARAARLHRRAPLRAPAPVRRRQHRRPRGVPGGQPRVGQGRRHGQGAPRGGRPVRRADGHARPWRAAAVGLRARHRRERGWRRPAVAQADPLRRRGDRLRIVRRDELGGGRRGRPRRPAVDRGGRALRHIADVDGDRAAVRQLVRLRGAHPRGGRVRQRPRRPCRRPAAPGGRVERLRRVDGAGRRGLHRVGWHLHADGLR